MNCKQIVSIWTRFLAPTPSPATTEATTTQWEEAITCNMDSRKWSKKQNKRSATMP